MRRRSSGGGAGGELLSPAPMPIWLR